eukprot:TRINITY_DN92378_c0_g1_i1.p1 TRINITY_DN92378_c0_g1~~TRINITY_DN92378_c0_g1_i1.p1  ORF type:complete len:440 (-),score=84.69 TRINITY_DN92378_c0_g1_i1:54-1277(-)
MAASTTTTATLGKPIVFEPATGSCDAAVLWLHGFGDKAEGWASALRPLRDSSWLPSARWKWVHLRAPLMPQPAYDNKKLPGWGQFWSEECLHVGGRDHEDEDAAGFYAASVAAVRDAVAQLGVPPGRIVLGGFSQGAALALATALSLELPLAGCVVLSGWLLTSGRAALRSQTNACSTPLLVCHGTKDDMVGFDCATFAVQTLLNAGIRLQFLKYVDLKHESCPQELDAVSNFLQASLAPDVVAPDVDWEAAGTESDSDISDDEAELIYVHKTSLEGLKDKLQNNYLQLSDCLNDIDQLGDIESLADEEIVVPLAIDYIKEISDLQQQLGTKGAAATFVLGAEAALEARDRHLTVSAWREMMTAGSEELDEGEEESLEDDDEIIKDIESNIEATHSSKRPKTVEKNM